MRGHRSGRRPSSGIHASARSRPSCQGSRLGRQIPFLRSAWEVLGTAPVRNRKEVSSAGRYPGPLRNSQWRQYRPSPGGGPGRLHTDLGRRVAGRLPAAPPVGSTGATADTAANVDLLGRPVACARFMAGRSTPRSRARKVPGRRAEVGEVAALVAAGTMALPSFQERQPGPGTAGKGRLWARSPTTGARG